MFDYDLSAYLSVFLDEADEQLQILDEKILELEKDPFNEAIIQSIFRAAHTLKGSSASMGFEKLKEFTHHIENIFEQIRQKKIIISSSLIDVLFEGIDLIKLMKEAIIENKLDEIDISNDIVKLESFLSTNIDSANIKEIPRNNSDDLESFQISTLLQGINLGFQAFDINVKLDKDASMKNVRAYMVHNVLTNLGEIIATVPTIETMEQDESFDGSMEFKILSKTNFNKIKEDILNVSDVSEVTVLELKEKELKEQIPHEYAVDESAIHNQSKITPTIRVDIDKLEHLMGLVGELVINQTRLVDVRGRFSEKEIRHESEFDVLNEVTNQLSLVISELQDGMMKTRMLPIEQLFNRFPRLVRDTSMKANKDIHFEMLGKETELDRTLIEELSDPLIHLIRNAIDHGIENEADRIINGKSPKGNVTISAEHEEKHVVIKIQDDGRGIDPDKIKKTSVEKGIITQEEANKINDKEAMFLIFKSGISTAEKITDISGRGVGMDIVKSHIEKINGVIDIDSRVGQGTTFTIKLPLTLTLSIIRALLIKLGDKTFAVPLVNVLEILRINTEDIQTVKDQEVALVRGRVLPLIRMKQKLGLQIEDIQEKRKREFVVVVGFADKRVGIIVDKTIGNQEIVTKSLGSYIGHAPFISGATIMGDANVALILDVPLIVKEFGSQIVEVQQQVIEKEGMESNQLVTFKVENEEYGIDIHLTKDIIPLTTLTRVVDSSPEVLGIINLRGNTLPVIDLRKRLNLPEIVYTKKARIIVVEHDAQDIGLLVDEVTQVFKSDVLNNEQCIEENNYNTSKLVRTISKVGDRIILNLALEELFKTIVIKQNN